MGDNELERYFDPLFWKILWRPEPESDRIHCHYLGSGSLSLNLSPRDWVQNLEHSSIRWKSRSGWPRKLTPVFRFCESKLERHDWLAFLLDWVATRCSNFSISSPTGKWVVVLYFVPEPNQKDCSGHIDKHNPLTISLLTNTWLTLTLFMDLYPSHSQGRFAAAHSKNNILTHFRTQGQTKDCVGVE